MIRDKEQQVKQDEENETIGLGAVAKRVFRQELWGGLGEVWARQKEQHMQMPRGRTDLPVRLDKATVARGEVGGGRGARPCQGP